MADAVYSPAQIVTMAWDRGQLMSESLIQRTQGFFANAMDTANDGTSMEPAELDFEFEIEDDKNLKDMPALSDWRPMEEMDERTGAMMDELVNEFAQFIATYFPDEAGLMRKTRDWIGRALSEGGSGMSATVERQIWERDRSRILKDARRQESEAISSYAARGFPVPPGAMLAAVQRVRSDADDRIAQASRDVAIKQAELEIENVRFAVDKALQRHASAMDAARAFIAAQAGTIGVSAQLVPSIMETKARMVGASTDYYRARTSVEDLRLRAAMPNAEYQQQAQAKNLDARMGVIKHRVDAAVEAAKALSVQAAAMLNALHVSSGTSASGSMGISYSYSGGVTGDVPPVNG